MNGTLRKIEGTKMGFSYRFGGTRASWSYKGYKLEGINDGYLAFKPNGDRWQTCDSLELAVAVIDERLANLAEQVRESAV